MRTRRKPLILVGLVIISCLVLWWLKRPSSIERARKETDVAVSRLEQVVKSQDKTVERIVTGARKEVSAKNEKIRKNVSALSGDAVAAELIAILYEYRRERGD